MGKYTASLPKAMLPCHGKTLLEWQIAALHRAGVHDIVVVTGYCADQISYPELTYIKNECFANTNMLETLMCAREVLEGEVLVAYSDILYLPSLANQVRQSSADIGVAVDANWRDQWLKRFGTTETDLESLEISDANQIVDIGKQVNTSEGLDYRYIGLLKFSEAGVREALRMYDSKKRSHTPWKQSGNPFLKGYMTDLLHDLILDGHVVTPIITHGGWYEFDTETDYEIACGSNWDELVGLQ